MKNLKISFAIVIIFIVTITISVSCSENENKEVQNSSLTARVSEAEINQLKAEFILIMESQEYINFHNSVKIMEGKMNNEQFTFRTRQAFVEWINGNLNKTLFTSTQEAIELYDYTTTELSNLRSNYSDFYNSLISCDIDEILVICAPELVHPPLQTSKVPCVTGCVNVAETAFHIADITFEYAMNTGDVYMAMFGSIAYHNENAQITQNYINCFGNCSV